MAKDVANRGTGQSYVTFKLDNRAELLTAVSDAYRIFDDACRALRYVVKSQLEVMNRRASVWVDNKGAPGKPAAEIAKHLHVAFKAQFPQVRFVPHQYFVEWEARFRISGPGAERKAAWWLKELDNLGSLLRGVTREGDTLTVVQVAVSGDSPARRKVLQTTLQTVLEGAAPGVSLQII